MIPLLFWSKRKFPLNKPSERFFRSGDFCTVTGKRNNHYGAEMTQPFSMALGKETADHCLSGSQALLAGPA